MDWFVVRRPSDVMYTAAHWSELLDHDDVTRPGRFRAIGVRLDDGRQLIVELEAHEMLRLVERNTRNTDGIPMKKLLIFGLAREDGTGSYIFVHPSGNITLSSDFDAHN